MALTKKTISEHTQGNILVIPQALFSMQDITVLHQHQSSAIFYKDLQQDLVDIEFYTNTPCFIYLEHGREVITNSQNQEIELTAGSGAFLPQGLNLHSDFVKETESLKAWLVFFDDDVIKEYLVRSEASSSSKNAAPEFYILHDMEVFQTFFNSLQKQIKNPTYLTIKLLELLHLIACQGNAQHLHTLLTQSKRISPRRNLIRLLSKHEVLHLTVNDMAHLSGRSLSSFNRDFKALYNTSPKKWLQEKRLAHAKNLLVEGNKSVTEVAVSVGYDNVSNFIKAFKVLYGQTPKQIKSGI